MPTYDYRCGACDAAMEIFQPITESARRKCPECGALKLKRLIGAGAGLIFKGSGFYTTDYRSASYRAGARAADSSSGDTSSGSPKKD